MRTRQLSLLVTLLFVPMLCRAEEGCLWINAATAGGVLGGTVNAVVSRPNAKPLTVHPANAVSSAGPTSANLSSDRYSNIGVDDSDCAYTRKSGPASELRVEVRTMSEPGKEFASYAARCAAPTTPLKAIGNEASVCTLDDKAGHVLEQVVGRVRERAFVIRLSTSDSSITQSVLREKILAVAELVSGNLF